MPSSASVGARKEQTRRLRLEGFVQVWESALNSPKGEFFYLTGLFLGYFPNFSQKITPEEKWEQATLANNFIFYKVMRHHPDACKHLIEMLLNIKIEKMEMHSEEVIDLDHDSKSVRLDVFLKDTGKMYEIEMQATNTLFYCRNLC